MSSAQFFVKIPRKRAELPALIVIGILVMIGFAFHFDFFSWTGGLLWLVFALPLCMWIYQKRHGEYFVKVDENGISWREHFFSSYTYIPWKYIQRIDYLVYEINFMLKETAQVVCFATSGLSEEETDRLKQEISDIITKRKEEELDGV